MKKVYLFSLFFIISALFNIARSQCIVNPGEDGQACGFTYTLDASGSSPGGVWTGLGNFADANSPITEVDVAQYGVYVFVYTVETADCKNSGQVSVEFGEDPTTANAGSDYVVCGLAANLTGNDPAVGTGIWTGNGTFSDSENPGASVSVGAYGTYDFTWTTSNCNCPTSSDVVSITFMDPEIENAAFAGYDFNTCASVVSLNGNAPMDGATGMWTGPGAFFNVNDPNSDVQLTGQSNGPYLFTWTISNPCGTTSSDQVVITYDNNLAGATAGENKSVCGL